MSERLLLSGGNAARRLAAAAAAAAAILAVPASGQAARTIGSTLGGAANAGVTCGSVGQPAAQCTFAQTQLRDALTRSPLDGVITRWRIRSASAGTVQLVVLRPAGDAGFQAVAASAAQALPRQRRGSHGRVFQFPARIPVRVGDLIGIDRDRRAAVVYHFTGRSTDQLIGFDPGVPTGQTRPLTSSRGGVELLVNATIEPDADRDGFGDETQDNCPTIANDQTTNPCTETGQVSPTPGATGPGQTGAPTEGAPTSGSTRTTLSQRHRRRHRLHSTTIRVPTTDLG